VGGQAKPLVMRDTGFWPIAAYDTIITSIGTSGMRDWTNLADFGAAGTGGATGINNTQWTTIRGVDYRGAEKRTC
jgi:hypothetical protein